MLIPKHLFIVSCLFICFSSIAQQTEFDSILNELKKTSLTDKQKAIYYNDLGYYLLSSEVETAKKYIDSAIYYSKRSNDNQQATYALYYTGEYYLLKNDLIKATEYFLQVKNEALTHNINKLVGDAYDGIGEVFSRLKNYNRSLYFFFRALNIAQNTDDAEGVAYSQKSIGTAFRDLNQFDSSLYYLTKAKLYFEQHKIYPEQLGLVYLELGKTHHRLVNIDSAQMYLQLSKSILEKYDMKYELQQVYNFMGYSYLFVKDFITPFKWFKQSNELAIELGDSLILANSFTAFGDLYRNRGNYDSAFYYFNQAFAIYKKYRENTMMLSTYLMKISLAAKQKQYKLVDSLSVYSWFVTVQFGSNEVIGKIESMLAEDDAKSFEKENEILKERNKLYKRERIIILIAICALSLALLYAIYLYRQRNIVLQQERITNQKLQKLDNIKSKVLSIISHDLRSPLTSTYSLLDLYNSGQVSQEELSTFAPLLQNEVRNSLHLTDNLLHWTKSQIAGIEVSLQKADPKQLIQEVLDVAKLPSANKKLRIVHNVESSLVFTDPVIATIIIRNLISNAIKFSHVGGTIYVNGYVQANKYVVMVKDEGIGMTSEQLQAIENQHSVTTQGTQNETGAGIGLRLVFEWAQLLNEQINYESSLNKGTAVFFTLKLD